MKTNKHFLLLLFVLISFSSFSQAQEETKPDYITSGYYQLIYEADIARLEGKPDRAFELYSKAEKVAPLLNQRGFNEMMYYAEGLMRNRQFDKAIYYAKKFAKEYGGLATEFFMLNEIDSLLYQELLLEYPSFNDSILLEIGMSFQAFYDDPERKALVQELKEMKDNDKRVRLKTANLTDEEKDEWDKVDEYNAKRFLEIIEQYGYPDARIYGANMTDINFTISAGLPTMTMHISARKDIEDAILQNVRDGKCPPSTYGSIIDYKILHERNYGDRNKKYIYGIYTDTPEDQIEDYEYLDERRAKIGMRSRKLDKRNSELFHEDNPDMK
ncbi:hypothetical protein M2132_000036 [Dysgonomonas sp. PH5-45]|uniref:hypothetical protein n=1 Tax=unclassified Dysgonomonas TaxID=2630389 RepID=UPI002474BBBB|nr:MULTISPECIES: hypothetical protein [unclassified Dysgonomonas]MDH6353719.1 hypothetical protein [Dysgonomonas sp. PH5-45]MDH6386622.1 hypothetical protein [Dysgonomonas sp. PH5-37]